jgi:hypothetical protein
MCTPIPHILDTLLSNLSEKVNKRDAVQYKKLMIITKIVSLLHLEASLMKKEDVD